METQFVLQIFRYFLWDPIRPVLEIQAAAISAAAAAGALGALLGCETELLASTGMATAPTASLPDLELLPGIWDL